MSDLNYSKAIETLTNAGFNTFDTVVACCVYNSLYGYLQEDNLVADSQFNTICSVVNRVWLKIDTNIDCQYISDRIVEMLINSTDFNESVNELKEAKISTLFALLG